MLALKGVMFHETDSSEQVNYESIQRIRTDHSSNPWDIAANKSNQVLGVNILTQLRKGRN